MSKLGRWLKRRLRVFDLLPDYFRSLAGHWQDALWGSSPIAVAFAVWWFLGNPPPWIIVIYLVSAMFIAGFYVWRDDHVRLMPKLIFGAARVVSTPTTTSEGFPGPQRVVAQIEVENTTDVALTGCRGHLHRVLKWSEVTKQWMATEVDESLNLLWSTVDEPIITLYPRMKHQLCVFFVDDVQPHIGIWARPIQHRMAAVFEHPDPNDIFRFDISVTADDCLAANISLRVRMGVQWDKPVVQPLS
jgi:hypothetical protein